MLAPGKECWAFALSVNLLVFLFTGNFFFRFCFYEMKALVICFRILSGKGLGGRFGTPEKAKSGSTPAQVRPSACGCSVATVKET